MLDNSLLQAAKRQGNMPVRFMAFAILLLLIFLSVQALYAGMAYVAQYRVHTAIDRWYAMNKPPSPAEWRALQADAAADLQRNHQHVDMLNALGRLYEYRAHRMVIEKAQQLSDSNMANAYYRQVIQLRPAWPYGWINLALNKAVMGDVDTEFHKALMQAVKLGPWEKNTLPTLVQLGTYAWPWLDAGEKKAVLAYFVLAQSQRSEEVHRILADNGQLTAYCALLSSSQSSAADFCF